MRKKLVIVEVDDEIEVVDVVSRVKMELEYKRLLRRLHELLEIIGQVMKEKEGGER